MGRLFDDYYLEEANHLFAANTFNAMIVCISGDQATTKRSKHTAPEASKEKKQQPAEIPKKSM
ncbi:hypothetical protein Dimus_017918, partial [Dionaea muscipula]